MMELLQRVYKHWFLGLFLFGVLELPSLALSARPLVSSDGACSGVNQVEVSITANGAPHPKLNNMRVRVGLGAGDEWQFLGDLDTAAEQTFYVCATNILAIDDNGRSVIPVLLRFDLQGAGGSGSEHYAAAFDLPSDQFDGQLHVVMPASLKDAPDASIGVNGIENIAVLGRLAADFKYSYNANCEVGVITEVTPGHEFGHGGAECDVFVGGRYCRFEYQKNVSGGSLLFPNTGGQLATDEKSCDQLEHLGDLSGNAAGGFSERRIAWYHHFTPSTPPDAEWTSKSFTFPFKGTAFGRGRFTNRPSIFVTGGYSTEGNLGGLAGADRICQQIAKKFQGRWVAWLSDGATDARDRFFFNGPFVLPNQEVVAYTKPDLLSSILVPINVGENGNQVAANGVWTGTNPDGTRAGYYCDNWTSSSSRSFGWLGESKSSSDTWTKYQASACSRSLYLYCLRAGDPSIFVAKDWDSYGDFGYPDFGTARADQRCQSIADAKGFAGAWQTWASETGHNAKDRTGFSGPFVLPDGNVVADNREDLLSGQLKHPVDITEDGDRITPGEVWTGTNPDGTATAQNCLDWDSHNKSSNGIVGYTETSGGGWTKTRASSCGERHYHYCVRE